MNQKYAFVFVAILIFAVSLTGQTPVKNLEFRNGKWFNGSTFTEGTWYTSKGKLSKKAPSAIDSIVDLEGRWVVPPMADLFSACLVGSGSADQMIKQYNDAGVFYVQVLANTREQRQAIEEKSKAKSGPQVVFANGVVTCTNGYPFTELEAQVQGVLDPAKKAERLEEFKQVRKGYGNAYWFLDKPEDLKSEWPKIMAQAPQVITIVLMDSDKNGGKEGKGLTPEVAKAVVKKAHKAGLLVFAHIEKPSDVTLALKIGVDGLANLPMMFWDGTSTHEPYDIAEEDWKKMIKKKIAVMPRFTNNLSPTPAMQLYHAQLLKRMLEEGINVVIGSGDPNRTANAELTSWYQLGGQFKPGEGLNYLAMLRALVENTPKAIFPDRKIGKIQDGYEASFVVLSDSPLPNLLKLRLISFTVKNGRVIGRE